MDGSNEHVKNTGSRASYKFRYFSGPGNIILMTFIYLFLILSLLVIALPIVNVVASSFSSARAVVAGKVIFWPVDFTLDGYLAVLTHKLIMTGFLNSILYTAFGTFMNITLTLFAAYPLSRNGFMGKKFITGFYTITMFIGGGMVPNYLLMKNLHLLNTRWVMIIPAGVAVYNMIIARTYMRTSIPLDLYGAAEIDGCSDAQTFFRIVLPLSKPIIAVLALSFAVGHWNSYFGGLMYLTDEKTYPLQLVLRKILILNEFNIMTMSITKFKELMDKQYLGELIKYSSIIVASLPMMILYPFIQKHFVKGVMLGSLKG